MKIRVSLPEEDAELLDDDYESAWQDWSASEDEKPWDATIADGVAP